MSTFGPLMRPGALSVSRPVGASRPAGVLHSLQAGRAVAASLVVLFHLGGLFALPRYFGFTALDGPFAWGDAGVDFFFVLSGFIITAAHGHELGHPERLRSYLTKRALRVFPTYWIVCALVLAAAWLVPSLRGALPADPLVLLKALALWPQDPELVGGLGSPVLFVAWSLQYELLFYGLFAAFIWHRAAGIALVVLLLAVNVGCHASAACSFPSSFFSSLNMVPFALGVLAAQFAAAPSLQALRPLRIAALGLLGFVGFGAAEALWGRDLAALDRKLVYALFSMIAIVGMAQAERRGHLVLRSRWIMLLGNSSYALYLLHMPVISALTKAALALHVSGPVAIVASFVAIFLLTLALAAAFHQIVEAPLLRVLQRLLQPAATRSAKAAHSRGGAGAKWL